MSARRRPVTFTKYSGAGNDFLILDERTEEGVGEASTLAKALCRRGISVGGDGLLVISYGDVTPESGGAARMHLYNADGSSAEFSGNAARCAIRYLVDEGRVDGPDVLLETDIGVVRGRVDGTSTSVEVPGTARVWPQRRIRVEGKDLLGTYVLVGVPFFVLLHDDPDELPVRYLGRAIRSHGDLQPAGANVDFVRIDDEQTLYFRVYERGVENETLSSGTGSISAALAAAAAGRTSSPVACATRGGVLTVRFTAVGLPTTPDVETALSEEASAAAGAPETSVPAATTSLPEPPRAEVAAGAVAPPDAAAAPTSPESDATEGDVEDEALELPRVAAGEPLLFSQIAVEGDTRRVMQATAFGDALRLR